MYDTMLKIHIACGATALFVGPISMASRKVRGLHTKAGTLYHFLVLFVCVSGVGFAIADWEHNSFFFFVAIFSYSFLLRGIVAAKRRKPGWIKAHISGMLGSYIAMVTALLVVNRESLPVLQSLPAFVTWILPTVVGSPFIAMVTRKYVTQPPAGVRL